jgi:hypothetical protein
MATIRERVHHQVKRGIRKHDAAEILPTPQRQQLHPPSNYSLIQLNMYGFHKSRR